MDIGSLGNYAFTSAVTDTAGKSRSEAKLSNVSTDRLKGSSDDELMDVCRQFESYFLEQVFKEMKKTIPEEEMTSNASKSLKEYFEDELIREYSERSTQTQSLGLAQMLYEQMKRNMDPQEISG